MAGMQHRFYCRMTTAVKDLVGHVELYGLERHGLAG